PGCVNFAPLHLLREVFRRVLRALYRPLRRALGVCFPAGTGWGLLVYGGLFAWSLLTREGFSAFGVRDASIEKLVFGRFFGHVLWTQVQILCGYLAIGWVAGAVAGLVLRWAPRAFGREAPARWYTRGAAVTGALLCV